MNEECRLCKSKNIITIKHGVRDNSEIDVFKCKNCGLEFLSQNAQPDNNFYEKGGMHSAYSVERWFQSTFADDKRRSENLSKIIKNKNILDFGTGNGGFLKLAKKYAKSAIGLDLDKSLDEHYKNNKLSVKHSLEDFDEKFDVITMFHVLEHITEPEPVLENLKKYLKKGAKLIIEVPNSNDALLTMYKSEDFKKFTYWSCHIYNYNAKNLQILLKNSGYKINKVKYIQRYPYTNHIGWLKDKKSGGHKRYKQNNIINCLYTLFLKITKKTDTVMIFATSII